MLDNFEDDKERRFQQELAEALADAEANAEREKQRALMRLTRQMEEAQAKALKNQKEYFEKMAERVAEQRDRLVPKYPDNPLLTTTNCNIPIISREIANYVLSLKPTVI